MRDGNLRAGMFLETATTVGAVRGVFIATYVSGSAIPIVFGIVLLTSAYLSFRPNRKDPGADRPYGLATFLNLDSSYPTPTGRTRYHVHHVPAGYAIMFIAGVVSRLLGIGSGAVKVLVLEQAMRLPFKVSTTTSNFMVGVTAAASAGIYLSRGYIDPGLAMPVMLGVLAGSLLGTRVLVRAKVGMLRRVFAAVILVLGVEMIYGRADGKAVTATPTPPQRSRRACRTAGRQPAPRRRRCRGRHRAPRRRLLSFPRWWPDSGLSRVPLRAPRAAFDRRHREGRPEW
ncbi:MAG TPA: sulfite exporter TauE/SafE family protein [Vicinamibacterales bacterium]|nr:sulfite exporter TauE/SafE family protein [Vicinamibacterales bacterium]